MVFRVPVSSSLHSYLIASYAKEEGVSLDVVFCYMSNDIGRLIGTALSRCVYQVYGVGVIADIERFRCARCINFYCVTGTC